MTSTRNPFGQLGIWLSRSVPLVERDTVAQTAEALGYETIWLAGGAASGVFDEVHEVLGVTSSVRVGTSIANMWAESPAHATDAFHRLEADFPGRFYLGVGPSHAPLVAKNQLGTWQKPLAKSRSYLEEMDALAAPVPVERRVLSALGPLALRLSAERTLGSIPYLVPVAHTASARETLGVAPLLAPELAVVLEPDLEQARARAREFLAGYLGYPNYTGTFLRTGFSENDLVNGGSDRLVDAVFGLGSVEAIGARIDEHRAAGADHVAIQVLPVEGQNRVDVLTAIATERGLIPPA
ncbi:TIGR03620 family F420-dependent LLM class oxidoreductase [Glaciibacter sp. 2TAF33]|uniref:TIGR03620 family F420-dependent LLM class oxidoreductase n=1 Tax=Glaciibacter sp. 2TAF33 TaxID=3233015 RepID=UPI003F8EF1A0